jgi:peptide/nickel transport system permease protein
LAIIVIGFLIIELPPGDYLTFYVAQLQAQGYEGAYKEAELLRERYGLDEPAYKRFFIWLFNFVQGDFGESFAYRKPVTLGSLKF